MWTLPRPLIAYILLICTAWAVALVVALATLQASLTNLLTFALLLACGAVCIEGTRRLGQPKGVVRDLLAAWMLPIAFVLPVACSLLAPVVFFALTQVRVSASQLHRRAFTVAASGLLYAGVALTFQHLAGWSRAELRPGLVPLLWALLAVAVGAAAMLVSAALFGLVGKAADPEATWRQLLWEPDDLIIDAGERSIGAVLGLLCLLNPLLALVALTPVVLLQRALLHDQLTAAARLDAKTGLLNAPTWEREAAGELARAVRTGTPLCVMLLDLDHFKQVNDTYGHLVGDEVLTSVSAVMRSQLREYDLCARFGGDEFAILLPQSDLAEATRTAERIRRHVDAIRIGTTGAQVRTSVSIGLAQLVSPEQGVTDLLAAADLSLYRAKENRNQVHSMLLDSVRQDDDLPSREHF